MAIMIASELEKKLDAIWARYQMVLQQRYPGISQIALDDVSVGMFELFVSELELEEKVKQESMTT